MSEIDSLFEKLCDSDIFDKIVRRVVVTCEERVRL
jgi:hypothetical protein